jgi:TP901 family phage tail tape measure protein
MGNVPEHMQRQMGEAARRLSRELNIAAEDVARAFYFLASAGLSAEQSIAALPVVARFAKAGLFDLQVATDLLTDAQSALGLSSKDAQVNLQNMTRVSDVLVKAANLSNATVQQFSESLTNRAAPALRLVNKDIEEGVAVLAAMADQGVKGAEAGTRLDIVLRDLQTRALANRKEFKQFNIEVFDGSGKMRGLADIIADLEKAMDGMSDAQRRAIVQTLGFQDRSVSALLTLLGLSNKIREYEAGLRDAAGTTQDVADRQMRAIQERIGQVAQQWAELKCITAETILLPAAEWFLGIADAMLGIEAPLERTITLLRRFGGESAANMIEARKQIMELREEVARLRRETEGATVTIRQPIVGGFALPQRVDLSRQTDQEQAELREKLLQRLAKATAELDAASAKADTRARLTAEHEVRRLSEQIAKIDEFRAKREALAAATNAVADAEKNAADQRERFDLNVELEGINRRIDKLKEMGLATSEQMIMLERLEARRAEIMGKLAPPVAEAALEPGGGLPDPEAEAKAKRVAERRKQLLEQLADQLFAITATAEQLSLRALEKLQEDFKEAGVKITGTIAAQFDALRQHAEQTATLESIRKGFSEIAGLTPSADTIAGMEQMLAAAEAFRDSLREDTNLWRDANTLVAQMKRQLEGLQVTKFTAAIVEEFQRATTELDLQVAQHLISPEAAKRAAQNAAEKFNEGVLEVIQRLEASGELSDSLKRALVAQLKPTDVVDPIVRGLQEEFRRRQDELELAFQLGDIDKATFRKQGKAAFDAFIAAAVARARELAAQGKNDLAQAILDMLPKGPPEAPETPGDPKRARQEELRDLRDRARALEENARAGIQLAESIGLIGSEAAKALQDVAQLGAGLARLAGGDLTAIPIVVSSAVSLGKSFFGESPEAKAQKDAIERNTKELRRVGDELAGRRFDTGERIEKAREALGKVVEDRRLIEKLRWSQPTGFSTGDKETFKKTGRAIRRLLDDLGLSFEELKDLADHYGIEIFDKNGRLTANGLEALYERLNLAADALTGFTNAVDSQREREDLRADVYDEADDATARLTRELNLLQRFAPDLFNQFFAGMDPTTPAGRAAIEQAMRMLFEAFDKKEISLGGLTREEFLSIFRGIESAVDEAAAAGTGGETQAATIRRGITDLQANILIDQGSSLVFYAGESYRTQVQMLRALLNESTRITPPSPDQLGLPPGPRRLPPELQGAPGQTVTFGAGAVQIGPITIDGSADVAAAEEFGEIAGAAFGRKVSRILADRDVEYRAARGSR